MNVTKGISSRRKVQEEVLMRPEGKRSVARRKPRVLQRMACPKTQREEHGTFRNAGSGFSSQEKRWETRPEKWAGPGPPRDLVRIPWAFTWVEQGISEGNSLGQHGDRKPGRGGGRLSCATLAPAFVSWKWTKRKKHQAPAPHVFTSLGSSHP